ncbi:hypothetical protein KUV85_09020 [Nocardioides panacisoli]|uniref:DUF6752 domain-containing protein n=1 Tax=Nocardioides panacisoli TaxID=627624 RepID=UPI001C63AFDE|nr:DUF6752 domain-containing protein [Nocardioides panacisoli]QYJ02481.1 hypothetical protein KUV85_09020 [Nocardioides panacisoli]
MGQSGAKARVVERIRAAAGVAELEQELADLRAEVEEYRDTHVRFAELVDLVTELLVPLAQQDSERIEQVIARYTDELDQES